MTLSLLHLDDEQNDMENGHREIKDSRARVSFENTHLVGVMTQETGLPELRVRGETGRTCGQLRMFAQLVEDGNWVDARIDRAQPDRKPLPKPDLRSMLRPVGPARKIPRWPVDVDVGWQALHKRAHRRGAIQ